MTTHHPKKSIITFVSIIMIFGLFCLGPTPVTAGEPELIPLHFFFGGGVQGNFKISPDGKFLSYMKKTPDGTQIRLKTIGNKDDRVIKTDKSGGIGDYHWAYDNTHLIYLKDSDGDENFHVYALNLKTGKTKDLTPIKGVKAQNLLMDPAHPNHILAGLNKRDKRLFDMYKVNITTGKMMKLTENPGNVRWWLADPEFNIRAAVAISQKDSSTILRVRDNVKSPWRVIKTWGFGESGLLEGYGSEIAVAFTADGKGLYIQAAHQGDRTQLARMDAKTGKILEIIAKDDKACIWNEMGMTLYDEAKVLFHPETRKVQAVGFYYQKPKWKIYDEKLKKDFEVFKKLDSGVFDIPSRDLSGRYYIVKAYSKEGCGKYYFYDNKTGKKQFLEDSMPHLAKLKVPEMKPVTIKARDGLDIPCYLTLPTGIPAKNLPLVLFIHGGPWARDRWGYSPFAHWLGSRGYATLSVNYRGSAGFGKKFMNAGTGEWGVGYMQHDITDAVKHFVKKGIADPKRVAIIGGSYGGYAVLAGLTFTPDLYVCGVDLFGISNVRTSMESMPDWWEIIKTRWLRRIGPVLKDETFNRKISPLYHAHKIKAKLMIFHGQNDPRVKISESKQIVDIMRKNKKEVIYVVYPDEGHGIAKGPNMMEALARIENFLAKHLGGRALPFKKVPGSSAILK